MKFIVLVIFFLLASPAFTQVKTAYLKTFMGEEVTVSANSFYSIVGGPEFCSADLELRPKKSAQDKYQVATGFILHSMQELSVSYCMDHIEMYAKVENPFEIDWQDLQSEQELSSRIESCITSDPLFVVGTPRLLRLGIGYTF